MQKGQDSESPRKLEISKIPDFVSEDKAEVSPSKYGGRLRLFLIIAALVITLDQMSKLWVRINLPQTARIELLPGFLDLVHSENTGAILGLFHGHTELFIALGIAGTVTILVFLYYFPPATTAGMLSFALILGGAVGNLIDRIRLRHVIDFVSLHLQDLFHWPAFNVADAALTAGIFALIYYFYKSRVFGKAYERNDGPER